MGAPVPSMDLLERMRKGDTVALGRLISRAESGVNEARGALAAIFKAAGRAHIVGITGVPGSGKSTLVSRLVQAIRADGRRVGVIAIDPSSPFSGGAILGDRIRMTDLVLDPGVFIRSMATRGATGGLASATLAAADILDAGGFDVIIIETVGVGQDEVEIARASHTTVVVSAPGLGDDIQAIKAGILEIADIHVVSKCDRPDANRTIADIKNMMALSASLSEKPEWQVPVVATSSQNGQGIGELLESIDRHRVVQASCALGVAKRRHIAEYRALKTAEDLLRSRFAAARNPQLAAIVEQISTRTLDPFSAAEKLLNDATL
jgi:LAO/AO transport system kinase